LVAAARKSNEGMQPLCGARHGPLPLTALSTVAPSQRSEENSTGTSGESSIGIDTVYGVYPRTDMSLLLPHR
jgi:hypothetical protein